MILAEALRDGAHVNITQAIEDKFRDEDIASETDQEGDERRPSPRAPTSIISQDSWCPYQVDRFLF